MERLTTQTVHEGMEIIVKDYKDVEMYKGTIIFINEKPEHYKELHIQRKDGIQGGGRNDSWITMIRHNFKMGDNKYYGEPHNYACYKETKMTIKKYVEDVKENGRRI